MYVADLRIVEHVPLLTPAVGRVVSALEPTGMVADGVELVHWRDDAGGGKLWAVVAVRSVFAMPDPVTVRLLM